MICRNMTSFKINTMKEISIIGSGVSTMCRLCLSSGVTLLDIFCFSSKMQNSVAGVIMKYAPVQITRDDEMPNFICQSCSTQLEKTHQFLMQIEQADRTLRRHLQPFCVSDKPIKAECSVRPSEDNLFLNTNNDIVKCEPLELNDVVDMDLKWKESGPGNFIQENKNNDEMCLKSVIKVEQVDDYLYLPTESAAGTDDIASNDGKEFSCEDSKIDIGETEVNEDMAVNWNEKEAKNYIVTNKLMNEIYFKSEINDEKMDDNLLTLTESVDDTENASSNGDGNVISCEDTKINIGDVSENSCLRSAKYATGNISKCNEKNRNISITRKHKEANKLKSYQCDICRKCFSGASGLHYHKRTHTGEKPYKCNVCIKCFVTPGQLKIHQLLHTGENPYKCDLCKKSFSRSEDLIRHKRTHTGEKPYQCDLCNKCFSQSSHLNTHKIRHTGEKPYQCDLCNKCFSESSTLNDHKRTHTGEKPYQCDLCNKRFSASSNLISHKRTHTDEKPYQCDLCNKCFSRSSHLNDHKRTHTGEKPYQCDLCIKRFSNSFNLSTHKRTHTGEKPYKCDLCKKCFSQLSTLNEHKRTHTGEKPYQCDLCNKCFFTSSNLNSHKRTHTGEKPFQCDLCNKCFSQYFTLNYHKRTHTGEKPYQCDLCNKCFSASSTLNDHKRTHTGEKPYQCDLCNKCFSHSSSLNKHKLAHS